MGKEKNKEEKFETKKPLVETSVSISKDGRYLIHKTSIIDIKPVNYMKTVLKNSK